MSLTLKEIAKNVPQPDRTDYRALNQLQFIALNKTCIVIDDDPTGSQTVYDIPLLTDWKVDTLKAEFLNRTPCFYILTNSRSLTKEEDYRVYLEIGKNIRKASTQTSRGFLIISRSDSTLRGYFSNEIDALLDSGTIENPITFFSPVMFEGGRVTFNDTHYIVEDEILIPVNETPFAQDASFGYKHANLREWLIEKTEGRLKAKEIHAMSLKEVRESDIPHLAKKIKSLNPGHVMFPNAMEYSDLDKISNALLQALKTGKEVIIRSSSSLVPSLIGQSPKGLLTKTDMEVVYGDAGGLIVVGSYVPKSSHQLEYLKSKCDPNAVMELPVSSLLSDQKDKVIALVSAIVNKKLLEYPEVILYTSRQLITGDNAHENLQIGNTISAALVTIVNKLKTRPKYLLAKGGITSNDLATKALGMKRSTVLGQVVKGVPVWKMGKETKFPRLPYIVFPGNVGDEKSMYDITQKLT